MAYGDFKDLNRRTFSGKVLRDESFNIAENPQYDGHQRGIVFWVSNKFFDKKPVSLSDKSASGCGIANDKIKQNLQLAKKLHKPITRNFKKRTVYSGFKNNIWDADLADMQPLSKYRKGMKYLLCVIDLFNKYAWVIPIKDKKRYCNY